MPTCLTNAEYYPNIRLERNYAVKRILVLILLLPLLSFAAAPKTANPNSLTYIGVESTTGLSAAPYVDSSGNLAVAGTVTSVPATGTWTDRSGTIATGGTSQTILAANSARTAWEIQNPPTATENLCFNFTSAASLTSASICLAPGAIYSEAHGFVSTEAITAIAATTGHAFVAKEH